MHWTFLKPTQAVDAVAIDFQAYGPQPDLFRRMAPLVLGERCRIRPQDDKLSTVSILQGNAFYPVSDQNLGFYLIHVLETRPPDLNTLADICARVFQTRTFAGYDSAGTISGIWVHSQMESFVCRQCGECCRILNYETGCREADIRRWQDTGRTDILERVKTEAPSGNTRVPVHRIWMNPATGEIEPACPWLFPCIDPDRFKCGIHDTKPDVCSQYPYTGKHAVMTGCKGLFVPEPI